MVKGMACCMLFMNPWRFRWRLRSLMILVMCVSVAFGVDAWWINQHHREWAAEQKGVEQIISLGGSVRSTPVAPRWLALGSAQAKYLDRVESVWLPLTNSSQKPYTQRVQEALRNFPRLKYVDISGSFGASMIQDDSVLDVSLLNRSFPNIRVDMAVH